MPHFVRCIEGHVFDAEVSPQCPTCGAVVETVAPPGDAAPSIVAAMPAATTAGAMPGATISIIAAALIFGIGLASLVWMLHRSNLLPGVAPKPTTGASISVSANVSDTLQTTLDVARMLLAVRQKNYQDALSKADSLVARNNPIGMYIKAGILSNGLTGARDMTQARALLTQGAHMGDPGSLLILARFLEGGIGGPKDMPLATSLYLLAARGMAPGADENITRLHLNGSVGMTALDAYQTLLAGTATPQAMQAASSAITILAGEDITPAVCLSTQLAPLSRARGWNLHDNKTGADIGADQIDALQLRSFQYGAQRFDPWCEWGMGKLASTGIRNYPKNLVEADVFYRLAEMHKQLGSDMAKVKDELAAVERQMTPAEKSHADALFHGVVPASMAP